MKNKVGPFDLILTEKDWNMFYNDHLEITYFKNSKICNLLLTDICSSDLNMDFINKNYNNLINIIYEVMQITDKITFGITLTTDIFPRKLKKRYKSVIQIRVIQHLNCIKELCENIKNDDIYYLTILIHIVMILRELK